jgi:hypothetical protein
MGGTGQTRESDRGVCCSFEEEEHVLPFTATLPRLPGALWQRIDQALANLDACMVAAPCQAGRIEADAAYVERLVTALKEACGAIQAGHLKNEVIDPRSWPMDSQAEAWARTLLQIGFDPALTSDKLAAWLGQTNGEGERPGGDVVFFGLMRSCLSAFAAAFRETTRPHQASSQTMGPASTSEQVVAERLRDAIQAIVFYSTHREYEEAPDKASTAISTIRVADIAPPGQRKETWLQQFKVDAFKLYRHITGSRLALDQLHKLQAAMIDRQDELWPMSPGPDNDPPEPQAVAGASYVGVLRDVSLASGLAPAPNPFRQLCDLVLQIREQELERDRTPAHKRVPHKLEHRATLENGLRDLLTDCCVAGRHLGEGREREAEEAAQQLVQACLALLVWEDAVRLGRLRAEEASREKGGPCVALCNRLYPSFDRVDHLARLHDRLHPPQATALPAPTGSCYHAEEPVETTTCRPFSSWQRHVVPEAHMALTGHQKQEFWEALRAAFNLPRLREMVRFGLDKRLDDISVADNLRQIVFDLIEDAEMAGYTMQLLNAARQSQPGNEKLLAFAEQFNLSVATAALEKIVREKLPFLPITQWRARLGEVEVRVCRVETGASFGTGFLVGPDLVMTNYHVVEDVLKGHSPAGNVVFRFDYRQLADGKKLNEGTTFKLHDSKWCVDESPYSPVDMKANLGGELPDPNHLDYALLRLDSSPGTMPVNPNEPNGQPRGWFKVPTGPISLKPGDPLHIVQHPDTQPLVLALDTEAVLGINGNGTRVRYRTNTEPGSSGSPCCDANWNLVALHHVGDPKYGPLSKMGDWNQGILFDAIVKRLNEQKLSHLFNQALPQPT